MSKKLYCLEFSGYRKNSKNWDSIMITVIVVKVERYGFTLPECIQKGGDGIANSVDPDQTAPRSSLFWVCTVCSDLSVPILKTFTVVLAMQHESSLTLRLYLLPKALKNKHPNIQVVTLQFQGECMLRFSVEKVKFGNIADIEKRKFYSNQWWWLDNLRNHRYP